MPRRRRKTAVHMHRFLVTHKKLVKPFIQAHLEENDKTYFNLHIIDELLCEHHGDKWKPITFHFRCWIISEVLLDEGLKMWSGKSHRVMYRPQESEQATATA